jgi:acyl dehydratase
VAWLGHLVTSWMGNAGVLRRLNVMVLRHNLIGDTTWCRGRVTDKSAGGVVTLALEGTNQRGEIIAAGTAEVVLPGR